MVEKWYQNLPFGVSGWPCAENVLKWYQNCSFGASGRPWVRNGRKIALQASSNNPSEGFGPSTNPSEGFGSFNQPFRGVWFLQPTLPRGLVPSTNPSEGMGPTERDPPSGSLQPTLPRGQIVIPANNAGDAWGHPESPQGRGHVRKVREAHVRVG